VRSNRRVNLTCDSTNLTGGKNSRSVNLHQFGKNGSSAFGRRVIFQPSLSQKARRTVLHILRGITNMSTTPMKSPRREIDIETISSIKKSLENAENALENATALLESLMIDGVVSPSARDGHEIIDHVSPDDDKENFEPNVSTPSVKVETSRTPDKGSRSPRNKTTSPMWSKVDGLARALRTMNRRDSKDSEVATEDALLAVPPRSPGGILKKSKYVAVSFASTEADEALYEVRVKLHSIVVHANGDSGNKPWYKWNKSSDVVLKLYRHEESGANQLVLRMPGSGIVSLNLAIRGNIIDMEMHIPQSKNGVRKAGQVAFFAREEGGAMKRIVLNVNRKNVETLYNKLVELGATPKK
jgi:hypothetical protein